MSDGKKYYCFCGSNCKYETMTREQILAAIVQAVETGEIRDVDTGFVTKIKEKNGGRYVTFWVGTQAEYNALESTAENCVYIITDDAAMEDLRKYVEVTANSCEELAQEVSVKAAAAVEAAANAKSVDISSKVTFAVKSGGSKLTTKQIYSKVFFYVPALRMVFVYFKVMVNGTVANGESIVFKQSGGYLPLLGTHLTPLHPDMYRCEVETNGDWWITSLKAGDTGGLSEDWSFTGFYFCDGEG